jgi:hypothetical protein
LLEVSKMYKLHLNAPGGVEKLTALHLAAQSNSYEILQSILEEKPDLFVESATEQRPSSTVTKNLLLVKLLKKEERRFCYESFATVSINEWIKPSDKYMKFKEILVTQIDQNRKNALESESAGSDLDEEKCCEHAKLT